MFKILTFFIIGGYIIYRLFSIVPQFSGLKTITVYKENYRDSDACVKGYKTTMGSVKTFDVKVKPNDFWDRILLTDKGENLLGDILKIALSLTFAYYIYILRYDNVFSKKSFNVFWLILLFCVLNYCAIGFGTDHTRDFFRDLYISKGGNALDSYDFQARLNPFIHNSMFYYWVPLILINLYRWFKDHHEGKPEEDW